MDCNGVPLEWCGGWFALEVEENMHALENRLDAQSQRDVLRSLLVRKMWWADEATVYAYLYLEDGYQKHLGVLKSFLGDLRGKLILDVGCGTGGMCVALARNDVRAIGIDLFCGIERDDPAIARARAACYDTSLVLCAGQAQALPFSANTFDAVVSIGMIEHILNKKERLSVFKEAMRVLRPGGIFFVTAHPNRFVPYDMHFGFLPFVNWIPKPFRKRYVSLLKPTDVGAAENAENVSTKEFRRYLIGRCDEVVNVWPRMALPIARDHRGEHRTFLGLLSWAFRELHLESVVYQIARLMTWTSTELVVCLVARKAK